MKKFKVLYVIIIILSLFIIITKGIQDERMIHSYSDYKDYGIVDGFSGSVYLFDYNIMIACILFIFNFATTVLPESNKIKKKWLIFTFICILLLFIPIGRESHAGGYAGISVESYLYLWNIFLFI